MRRVLIMLGFVLLVGQPLYAQETIGPFQIEQAPESATGSMTGPWANVVNTPVTLNEAFSGFSIIADGWINVGTGDFYEATFNPPVVNGSGPDIVVFDARYDSGDYTLRTSYDGFTASWVTTGWVDSGVNRSYYYGGAGPANADVWGVEVDLSDLGVPDGASAAAIRVTANNSACDPLGVGALNVGPLVTVNVPTLSSAGLIILTVMMTTIAVLLIRRRIA
jgi:hypothetical protein